MKKLILSLFLLSFFQIPIFSQCYFSKQLGGNSLDEGYAIKTDFQGNIYITGFFSGVADFDPGPGVYNLTSFGAEDIFVTKLDYNGNFIWAKQMGGPGVDYSYSISFDENNNSYLTGFFSGIADFNPSISNYNLTSFGLYDVFICKLDPIGNFIWAKQIGGNNNEQGKSISVINNSIVITGNFRGTVDFNPGLGLFNLSSPGIGVNDVFICKLDTSGNFLWAKQIGGNLSDDSYSSTTDNIGNIFIAGHFDTNADFDPGAGAFILNSNGGVDVFVTKLDNSGNLVWAKNIGGISNELESDITCDNNGNVIVIGNFNGLADFDPGPGTFNLSPTGPNDIFICKLDPLGNYVWAKQMGGNGIDYGYSIDRDDLGYLYSTGSFSGTADFDPGVGIYNLSSIGNDDIFLSKLDYNGNFIWAKQMGGPGVDYGLNICIDPNNNLYATGFFSGTADLNPEIGTDFFTSYGSYDVFINKMLSSPKISIIGDSNICQGDIASLISSALNGNIWSTGETTQSISVYTGGQYYVTVSSQNCIDTSNIININVYPTSSFSQSLTVCQGSTITVGTNIYYNSGEYVDTLVAANGCDSIVTTTLTVTDCSGLNSDIMSKIKIYPIPATTIVELSIPLEFVNSSYFLIDKYGRNLMQGILKNTVNPIDISTLIKGLYFIKIGDYNSSIKIIKE
jgi:hypothetical protein